MPDKFESFKEEVKVTGEDLLKEVKRLIHEGNVTHIVIKNEAGVSVMEFPINIGLIGAVLMPIYAAVAAIAIFATHYTIVITRTEPPAPVD